MIAVEKGEVGRQISAGQSMGARVAKRVGGAAQPQCGEQRFMGNAPQGQDHFQVFHALDGLQQVRPALFDFLTGWLVLWRQAAHRIGYQAIVQGQAVVGPGEVSAARQPVVDHGLVQKIAGIVAGERAPGTVGALSARR